MIKNAVGVWFGKDRIVYGPTVQSPAAFLLSLTAYKEFIPSSQVNVTGRMMKQFAAAIGSVATLLKGYL
jgi:hypothetical protein